MSRSRSTDAQAGDQGLSPVSTGWLALRCAVPVQLELFVPLKLANGNFIYLFLPFSTLHIGAFSLPVFLVFTGFLL